MVQVKYEMVRRVRMDGAPVRAAGAFGTRAGKIGTLPLSCKR